MLEGSSFLVLFKLGESHLSLRHNRNITTYTVNHLIDVRGVYLILGGPKGGVHIERRRLKEKGVCSHNGNKLNETTMLSAKISRELINSILSSPSIGTSWPSKYRYRSFKSQCPCQNPRSGS